MRYWVIFFYGNAWPIIVGYSYTVDRAATIARLWLESDPVTVSCGDKNNYTYVITKCRAVDLPLPCMVLKDGDLVPVLDEVGLYGIA